MSAPPRRRAGQKSRREETGAQHPSPPVSVSRQLAPHGSGVRAVNPACHSASEPVSDTGTHVESLPPPLPKGRREGRREDSSAGSQWTFQGRLYVLLASLQLSPKDDHYGNRWLHLRQLHKLKRL